MIYIQSHNSENESKSYILLGINTFCKWLLQACELIDIFRSLFGSKWSQWWHVSKLYIIKFGWISISSICDNRSFIVSILKFINLFRNSINSSRRQPGFVNVFYIYICDMAYIEILCGLYGNVMCLLRNGDVVIWK